MKTVNYYGHDVAVPDDVTHLAADSDGTVYAYIGEPVLGKDAWWHEHGLLEMISTCHQTDCPKLDTRSVNWRDSLKEIKP